MSRRRLPSVPTCLILLVALLLGVGMARAPTSNTIHVDCTNTTGIEDGTEAHPYDTIQEGIDAAVDGNTVLVYPCTYYENIDFLGKAITVTSTGPLDPSIVDTTVIDGGGAGTVVTFASGEVTWSTLTGFTVTNGSAEHGGGIYCFDTAPTIRWNRITGNSATYDGGGVCCDHSGGFVGDNTITGNHARYGAGIHCDNHAVPIVAYNVITGNTATRRGGGIHCFEAYPEVIGNTIRGNDRTGISCDLSSAPTILSNIISGNRGSGIRCRDCARALIADNTISGNTGSFGGGIFCFEALPSIENNTITDNTAEWFGGGIYGENPGLVSISSNTIARNTAKAGAGIGLYYGASPLVDNNDIIENVATSGGGGLLCCSSRSSPIVTNNRIANNRAHERGGGILCLVEAAPILANNTINDNSADVHGGGISCFDDSSPIITDNTITNNHAGTDGGAISLRRDCLPDIARNTITDNTAAERGGGIDCYEYSSPAIAGNTISANTATYGGGVGCQMYSSPSLANNVIAGNNAVRGGGIFLNDHCSPAVTNCTIADNTATSSGDGITCFFESWPTVCNSIVWNRIFAMPPTAITVTYSDTLYSSPGTGNISVDPEFVDPLNGDYHLLPTSPCIDVGLNECAPEDDIDGDPRPLPPGGIVDMGADEVVPPPTCEISYTPSSPTTDDVITFSSGAADPYDMVIWVAWDFGDGGTAHTDPAAHQYAMPGTYEVTVTVCNAGGVCTTCTLEIMAGKGANILPVCDVTYEPADPEPGQEVPFDANAYDPNPWGVIVSCDWDFGDGDTGSGDPAAHAYADDGTYTVCATVTDDQGGQATCCTQVVVTYPCLCDVAIDRTHCKMPAAGHIGQCKRGQIGARNMSLTEPCDVVLRVIDNAGNVIFETTRTIGPGRRIRVRFDHCYTADEIGRNLWTWEVWPAECNELTPWNNVHLRKVNVQPGVRASAGNWPLLWRLWRR